MDATKKIYYLFIQVFFSAFTAIFFIFLACTAGYSSQTPPEGLSLDEWDQIRSQVRQAKYHIHPARENPSRTFTATNPNHGFHARFQTNSIGIRPRQKARSSGWNWTLKVSGYGYGEDLQPVLPPEIVAENNRVEYRRGNLIEWYVNKPQGVEQGFTLKKRPGSENGELLRIEMAVEGQLRPELSEDGQSILFKGPSNGTALKYHKLIVNDADGRTVPAHMDIKADRLALVIDDRNARYPLIVDPLISTQAKISAFYSQAGDWFGESVAIDGDIIAVGVPYDDDNGEDSGSVYIFHRNRGGVNNWGLVKRITASDGSMGDKFGESVAIAGDILAVGAPDDESGSVYLFDGSDNWGELEKLIASDGEAGDRFGASIAIEGGNLLIGAPNDDAGAAYVFSCNPGEYWEQIQKLTASDGESGDGFGFSVAISGDIIVIGAPSDDRIVNGYLRADTGSAYIFQKENDQWTIFDKLIAMDPNGNSIHYGDDQFGGSVAINSQVDTIIVGAPNEFNKNVSDFVGAAYVFNRNEGGEDNWGIVKRLIPLDPNIFSSFGCYIAIRDNLVAIGAYGDNNKGQYTGAVYLFDRSQGWSFTKVTASDAKAGNNFGNFVAISNNTLVVGADGHDDGIGGSSSGAVYVFDNIENNPSNWTEKKLVASEADKEDYFGYSVDINEDNNIMVVGVPYDDDYGTNSGSAYIFYRDTSGTNNWRQVKKITASDADEEDKFGLSVAISGDTVVIGSPYNSDQGYQSGAAYVFNKNCNGDDSWGELQKIVASDAAKKDIFGRSVAISGDVMVVGAPWDDSCGIRSGSVYVFYRNDGDWTELKEISDCQYDDADRFGSSVDIDNDILVVGAPYARHELGSVFVFQKDKGGMDNWGFWQEINISNSKIYDHFGNCVAIDDYNIVIGDKTFCAYIFELDYLELDKWGFVKKVIPVGTDQNFKFDSSIGINSDILVIGVPADGKDNNGSAYIFSRNQGGENHWGQVKRLVSSDNDDEDYFGNSVALNGNTAVVGAYGDDDGGSMAGSAYVFDLNFTPSVLSIEPADPNPSNAPSVRFTVNFSEKVSGVDAGDFELVESGTAAGTLASLSGADTQYTVKVTDVSGTGNLGLRLIDDDSITDEAGACLGDTGASNGNFTSQSDYAIDRDNPEIVSLDSASPDGTYKIGDPINISLTFSESVTLSGGTLDLSLDTGDRIAIAPFTESKTVSATYIVGPGDHSPDLDAMDIALSGGNLCDRVGNPAEVALPETTIADIRDIVVDGGEPGAPIISGVTPTFTTRPTWTVHSGGEGSGRFRYKLNDSDLQNKPWEVTGVESFDFQPAEPLDIGMHTLYVQEMDTAGNWSEVSTATLHVVRTTVPVFGFDAPVSTTTPTWRWSGLNGLGGTGKFRFKLDDSDLSEDAIETSEREFQPVEALEQGEHTLYVQEQDAAGYWSLTGSATVDIRSPESGIVAYPTEIDIREPQGQAELTLKLAVKPRFPVIVDLYSADTQYCTVSPQQIVFDSDNWDSGVRVTIKDAAYNLINSQTSQIVIQDAVSQDPYFDGMRTNPLFVRVRDDAAFNVYSIKPRYGVAGDYVKVTVMGAGFDENTQVSYKLEDGQEFPATFSLYGSTLIEFTLPDENQSSPPQAKQRYTVIVTNGDKRFEKRITIVSKADLEALKRKKALIVAGGGDGYDGDYLWSTTQALAQKAKEALEYQGYVPQSILQLTAGNPDPQRDATPDNLYYALTQWATEPFEPGYAIDELLIYMTDHGLDGKFILNGASNLSLSAQTLGNWLDYLQDAHPNLRVILIYDACHAGSFIEPLTVSPEAPYERIIVASTQAGDTALFADSGRISFSRSFWKSVMDLGTLYRSFNMAKKRMNSLGQMPLIQIPAQYNWMDNDIKIGLGLMIGEPPIKIRAIYSRIGQTPRTILECDEKSVTIGVSGIEPADAADHVYAEILYKTDEDPNTPITEAHKVELAPTRESGRYEKSLEMFTKAGQYLISVHAEVAGDMASNPKGAEIRQTCGLPVVKCDLNADETVDLKDAIIALQATAGIDDLPIRPDYEEKGDLDANADFHIGVAEAIYALKKATE